MRRLVVTGCAAFTLAACELQEVAIAEADPFVVVESLLSPGRRAVAAIHGSAGSGALLDEDANVELVASDTTIPFVRVETDACLAAGYSFDEADFPGGLACYAQPLADSLAPDTWLVQAGALYRLSVRMPDGSELDGATRVPERVVIANGAGASVACYLEPWTQIVLRWNSATGAAAYILDLTVHGLGEALAAEGIEADIDEPLALRGLAIGEADTTIVLPAEIGVFDRFGLDPAAALALQRGLPPHVRFEVVLAAVDENFVDWVRGGDFNPSGPLRTPSLFGDAGTGLFGSMTTDYLAGWTERSRLPEDAPSCATS